MKFDSNIFPINLLFIFLMFSSELIAQENCFNGIDDDGDGLIDLFDDECACNNIVAWDLIQGSICSNNLGLGVPFQNDVFYQWYKDSIAINWNEFALLLASYDFQVEGVYQCSYAFADGCRITEPYEVKIEEYNTDLGLQYLCQGETINFGLQELFTEGEYYQNLIASDGCDSTVYIEVLFQTCPTDIVELFGDFKEALIAEGFDTNGNGELQLFEVEAIEHLDLSNYDIWLFADFEKFINLKTLKISDAKLQELDLTFCPQLEWLDCSRNGIDELLLSGLSKLSFLDVSENRINHLDLQDNVDLKELWAIRAGVESMFLDNCQVLEFLNCRTNPQLELDVTKNVALKELNTSFNHLMPNELDVSKNVNLEILKCEFINKESFDFSNNVKLKYLTVENNNIDALDLSKNVNLEYINYSSNYSLEEVDLSNNPKLKIIEAERSNLKIIDLSKQTSLEYLNVAFTDLEDIDLSSNPKLKYITTQWTKIPDLDLGSNPLVDTIICASNLSLLHVNIQNGGETRFLDIGFTGNLEKICCDEFENDLVQNSNISNEALILNDCPFVTSVDFGLFEKDNIKVSPNPVSEFLRVESDSPIERVKIFTTMGEKIHVTEGENNQVIEIDGSNFPNGILLIMVMTKKSKHVFKVMHD